MLRWKLPSLKTNLCLLIFPPLQLEADVLGWKPSHTATKKLLTSSIKHSFRSKLTLKNILPGSNGSA